MMPPLIVPEVPRLPRRQREVFSAVLSAPGCSQSDVARATGLPLSAVCDLLRQLEWRDLVVLGWHGTARTCAPAAWVTA